MFRFAISFPTFPILTRSRARGYSLFFRCAQYTIIDDHAGDSSLGQGEVKASRGDVSADSTDDDKYGTHYETDKNNTEYQLIRNVYAMLEEIGAS